MAAFNTALILQALSNATAQGVNVTMHMEKSQSQAGAFEFDAIAKLRAVVTGTAFYVWNGETPGFEKAGLVLVKCIVADGESRIYHQRNLARAATDRNM